MKRLLSAVLSAGLSAAVSCAGASELECGADAPLVSQVRLEYGVTATRALLSISGEATVVFQRRGNAYTLESTQQALGLVEARQRSAGTVGLQGLVPRTFTQQSNRRPQLSVEFDWTAQRVTFSQTGASAPAQPQMQDRLSLLLQLGWRQRAEPRATAIEIPVAVQRRVSTYLFSARGGETLDLPAGTFETVKYERHRQAGEDALEVWLAPALCSLPVRMRFTDERGLVIEQQLREIRPVAP
jgi:hypothetical protein